MALADTSRAIGAVTEALKERIDSFSTVPVTVGRPDQTSATNPHLNLFLYEIAFDPHLKNTPLNGEGKAPLWMVLKYLLTAFEAADDSDSAEAHEHLGKALRAVYQDDLLKLDGLPADVVSALDSNPSELHVTFDESPSDLLAKLMQGTDEKLRISIAFHVRPVMIASIEPAEYSLLVGVDYEKPPVALSPDPVGLDVIPSMGAFISKVSPQGFEADEEITVRGTDLHLSGLSVTLGAVELPVTMQQPDMLKFIADRAIIDSAGVSAGSHSLKIVQTLAGSGKKRASNSLIANLVPTLNTAVIVGAVSPTVPASANAFATIDIGGVLLGTDSDDVILAFYRDGRVFTMFDVFTLPPGPPPSQTALRLTMSSTDAIEQGEYFMILKVNGQQAPQSPKVSLITP